MNDVKAVVLAIALLGAGLIIGWALVKALDDYCHSPAGLADDGCP
jgi:hypothetical protein